MKLLHSYYSPRPAWAAVAALGLAAACGMTAPRARAQDAVMNAGTATVSGSGTVLGKGYAGTGFSAALGGGANPYNSVQVNGGSFLMGNGGTVNGAFTDGQGNSYALETTGAGSATVGGGTVNYDVYAYNGSSTTLAGGTINGNMNYEDSSLGGVSGGFLNGALFAYGGSTAAITGGLLGGGGALDGLYAYDGSTVNISGGTLDGVDANGNSTVNISGGAVATDGVNALDGSTVNVTGGSLAGLDALSGTINLAGGAVGGTLITQGGVLDIFGQFGGYPPGSTITSGSGSFTGTLLYGGLETFQYDATQGGVIEFNVGTPPNPVPEAPTAAGLALGTLCLTALALRTRRRVSGKRTPTA